MDFLTLVEKLLAKRKIREYKPLKTITKGHYKKHFFEIFPLAVNGELKGEESIDFLAELAREYELEKETIEACVHIIGTIMSTSVAGAAASPSETVQYPVMHLHIDFDIPAEVYVFIEKALELAFLLDANFDINQKGKLKKVLDAIRAHGKPGKREARIERILWVLLLPAGTIIKGSLPIYKAK